MSSDEPIVEIVDTLEEATHDNTICLGDVLEDFGTAAFASTMLAVALLLVSPLSGVPLFSSSCGIIIFLIAVQGAIGRRAIWLPSRFIKLNMASVHAERAIRRTKNAAKWLDRHSTSRLPFIVSPPLSRVLYAICALAGLVLPLLELVPMSSSLVGLSISLISTGLLARDGLVSIVGIVMIPITGLLPIIAISTVFTSQ